MKWIRAHSMYISLLVCFGALLVATFVVGKVRVSDLLAQLAAVGHATLSVTIVGPSVPPPDDGAGGGGSGGGDSDATIPTMVTLSGYGAPGSTVTLLVRGVIKKTAQTGTTGAFELEYTKLSPGTYPFSMYGTDPTGIKSRTYAFTVLIPEDVATLVDNIGLPPTLRADKSATKRGDPVIFSGYTAPNATVELYLDKHSDVIVSARADASGRFSATLPTLGLESGEHAIAALMRTGDVISITSTEVSFVVGSKNVFTTRGCTLRADLNGDCKVNLVDFSIAAFWWERPLSDTAKRDVDAHLWEDGRIDLRDFSILAYYWTG